MVVGNSISGKNIFGCSKSIHELTEAVHEPTLPPPSAGLLRSASWTCLDLRSQAIPELAEPVHGLTVPHRRHPQQRQRRDPIHGYIAGNTELVINLREKTNKKRSSNSLYATKSVTQLSGTFGVFSHTSQPDTPCAS